MTTKLAALLGCRFAEMGIPPLVTSQAFADPKKRKRFLSGKYILFVNWMEDSNVLEMRLIRAIPGKKK